MTLSNANAQFMTVKSVPAHKDFIQLTIGQATTIMRELAKILPDTFNTHILLEGIQEGTLHAMHEMRPLLDRGQISKEQVQTILAKL